LSLALFKTCQIPDRSGLPSLVRGMLAVRDVCVSSLAAWALDSYGSNDITTARYSTPTNRNVIDLLSVSRSSGRVVADVPFN
jgi:hypothetical protein